MLKKIFAAAAIFLLLIGLPAYALADTKPIEIYINGQKVDSDVPPVIVNDRTLAPVRVISENLGAQVTWDNTNRLVKVATASKNITLKIDDKKAVVDGQEIALDAPATIVNDRTLVPLRFLSESLGADVTWDNDQRRVVINSGKTKITGFSYEVVDGKPAVVITGDGPLNYSKVNTDIEGKFAIDVEANLGTKENVFDVDSEFLDKAIAGEISVDPPTARIVLNLKSAASPKISSSSDKKNLYLTFDTVLKDVTAKKDDGDLKVNIEAADSCTINYFLLSNPDRLVLDIKNIKLGEKTSVDTPANDFVENIRLGQFSDDTVRVVFDLKKDAAYQVSQNGGDISVVFSKIDTITNIEVTNQGGVAFIDIDADGKINYEFTEGKNKKKFKLTAYNAGLGEDLANSGTINVNNGVIDRIEFSKIKDGNASNLEITFYAASYSTGQLLSNSPSSLIRLEMYPSQTAAEGLLTGKKIVVDPGHGGSECGALANGVQEKDINLGIGLKLAKVLEDNGAEVYMTRDDDTYVGLYERANMANDLNADLFISIHSNAATSSTPSGTETLYYPTAEKKLLAQAVQKALISAINLNNRGIVERPGLVVTRETKMPSVLVEVGFMTNPSDFALLMDDSFRQRAAEGICQGIIDYFSQKTD